MVEHPIHLFPGRNTGNECLEQAVPGRRPRVTQGSGGTLAPALGWGGTTELEGRVPKSSPDCVDPGLGTAREQLPGSVH